jgi:DNA-binding ferritin-like protein
MATKSRRSMKKRKALRKSIKRRPISKNGSKKSQIVHTFIEMLNVVKLYHWRTKSFSRHKATDELYSRLNENIDKFVEVFLGKDESRIQQWDQKVIVPQYNKVKEFKDKIYEFREFLIDLTNVLDAKRDSDLLNIRDEILGDINQFLYLMTFH